MKKKAILKKYTGKGGPGRMVSLGKTVTPVLKSPFNDVNDEDYTIASKNVDPNKKDDLTNLIGGVVGFGKEVVKRGVNNISELKRVIKNKIRKIR